MGQKVNPNGLRVGIIRDWNSRWYVDKKNFGDTLVEDYNIRKYLKKRLYGAGIPKIEIERTFDPKTGVLIRDGIDTKMNPYDLFALETALRLKEEHGGRVKTITMGPPQAEEIIKESFMMGADEGMIISDRKFAGADVLATACPYCILNFKDSVLTLGKEDVLQIRDISEIVDEVM